jgi:beta-hydroxylase
MRELLEKVLFYRDGDKTFFATELFPWVATIEAEWKAIRKELDALMLHREQIPNF